MPQQQDILSNSMLSACPTPNVSLEFSHNVVADSKLAVYLLGLDGTILENLQPYGIDVLA
jgi:hypothetical protein